MLMLMTRQRFSVWLILMMFLTSVFSGVEHHVNSHSLLIDNQVGNLTVSMFDLNNASINSEHCNAHNKFKNSCYTGNACNFTLCVDSSIITAFFFFIPIFRLNCYWRIQQSPFHSIFLLPEIKPPIVSL